jgi:hypothetical protein
MVLRFEIECFKAKLHLLLNASFSKCFSHNRSAAYFIRVVRDGKCAGVDDGRDKFILFHSLSESQVFIMRESF